MALRDYSIILEREAMRSDLTAFLTHLTRGGDKDDAYDSLWSILDDKKLKASEQVSEAENVVCFQDVPIRSIGENIRYEQNLREHRNMPKIRYSPFGIRVEKRIAFIRGARPVVYEKHDDYKKVLQPQYYWRYVAIDYDKSGTYVDWTHEREWRIKGDYEFEYESIIVVLPSKSYYSRFVADCNKRDNTMLSRFQGIDILTDCLV